jgi:hypothetical protein
VLGGGRYVTTADGYQAMRHYVTRWPDRVCAIEGCAGIGHHIAARLLADGEQVVDVPPKGLHCGQHRRDGRRGDSLSPAAGRLGEIDGQRHLVQVQGVVAHCGQDTSAERPIVYRVRQAEGLPHVLPGKPVVATVVCHPAGVECQLGHRTEE